MVFYKTLASTSKEETNKDKFFQNSRRQRSTNLRPQRYFKRGKNLSKVTCSVPHAKRYFNIIFRIEVIGYKEKPVAFDNTHPDWHEQVLLQLKDENLLLEGLNHAKVLTKTVELLEGLPESYKLDPLPKETDTFAKQIIKSSQIFDADQSKLDKMSDPARPFHQFPRLYGVSQNRRK